MSVYVYFWAFNSVLLVHKCNNFFSLKPKEWILKDYLYHQTFSHFCSPWLPVYSRRYYNLISLLGVCSILASVINVIGGEKLCDDLQCCFLYWASLKYGKEKVENKNRDTKTLKKIIIIKCWKFVTFIMVNCTSLAISTSRTRTSIS